MKISKSQRNNFIFLVIIVLLIIPQTRKPIQVFLNKGLALFSPSVIKENKQEIVESYNWNLIDENDEIIDFNEAKGKVVLLNFWATWCPPCIAEMPSMQELYNDYEDEVEFIFVSNESFEKIESFLTKNNYTFKVFRPIDNTNLFEVSTIPRTFLINKEGKIVIDKTGASNWNSEKVRNTIDDLLK